MADDKAPRCDGFPCEFHKSLWEGIGPNQHQVYHEEYNIHSLGSIINKGDIKLISNVDNLEDICNWRPITLLNVSYKIISKALSFKIMHFLLQIVSPKETDFIKSKYMFQIILFLFQKVWSGLFSPNNRPCLLRYTFPKLMTRLNGLSFWPCFKPQGLAQSFYNQLRCFLEMLILVLP